MDDEEMETDVPPSVRKRKMEDQPMEDEPEEEEEEEEEEEVIRACVIEGSKHADGSIYRRDTHFCHRDYWLKDTRESKRLSVYYYFFFASCFKQFILHPFILILNVLVFQDFFSYYALIDGKK